MPPDDPLGIRAALGIVREWTLTDHELSKMDPNPEWLARIRSTVEAGHAEQLIYAFVHLAGHLLTKLADERAGAAAEIGSADLRSLIDGLESELKSE